MCKKEQEKFKFTCKECVHWQGIYSPQGYCKHVSKYGDCYHIYDAKTMKRRSRKHWVDFQPSMRRDGGFIQVPQDFSECVGFKLRKLSEVVKEECVNVQTK